MAEDEVEALVLEGQRLGLGGDGGDAARAPSASAVALSRFSIPGEMSVAVSRSIDAELDQVEREVAGAGADLQGVAEGLAARARRAP